MIAELHKKYCIKCLLVISVDIGVGCVTTVSLMWTPKSYAVNWSIPLQAQRLSIIAATNKEVEVFGLVKSDASVMNPGCPIVVMPDGEFMTVDAVNTSPFNAVWFVLLVFADV